MSSSASARPKVNLRSTAVKRIMQEANELSDPTEQDFVAAPLETDIFEWHCTMRGVADSEFAGGLYHIRILLPTSYPMSAPDIIILTPNGRFELGKKICIDGLTSFHQGSWQPAWGVRTAILGLRSFWMQGGEALSAIGALDCSQEERRRLAKLSREWVCPTCACQNKEHLPETAGTIKLATVTAETIGTGEKSDEQEDSMDASTSEDREVDSITDYEGDDSAIPPPASSPVNLLPDPHSRHNPPSETSPLSSVNSSPSIPIHVPRPSHLSPPPPTTEHTLPPTPTRTIPLPNPPEPRIMSLPPSSHRRGVPLWLDALIFASCSMLLLLLARKAIFGGGRDEGVLSLREEL